MVPRARAGLARRRDQRRRPPTRAGACARGSCPRCATSTPPPSATSCAPPSCCATRPRCSTSSSTPRWPAATGSRSSTSPRSRARSRGSSCAAWPRRRPASCARAPPARLDDVLALGDGALDLGDGRARGRRGRRPALRAHTAAARCTARRLRRRMRDPAIGEILVQPDELKQRVRALGRAISEDYADRDLLLIGVLKGAVFFLADLMRQISLPCEVDFMAVSSYGSATDSSGVVRILKDLDAPIEGRHVLIVEDIVDSGLTLQYLMRNLGARNPALARGLRAADQARAAQGRAADPLRRLRDPGPLRDRLRARPRRELPQPAVRRRVGAVAGRRAASAAACLAYMPTRPQDSGSSRRR